MHIYRPGQPNWKYIIWKFQEFSAIQLLREIDFDHFEGPKTAILTIWATPNFNFWEFLTLFTKKKKIIASKIVKIVVFDLPKSDKIISQKIRMAEKLLHFDTVEYSH